MSRRRFATLLTFAACAACLARPAAAQLSGSDLPDLSGLAGAISDSVKTPPSGAAPAKKPAPGGVYHSGLVVPSVHPGETARGIGHQLRQKLEAKAGPGQSFQKLEDGMPETLTSFEAYMQKHGVAKRDMGVAIGVFAELNWETANNQELSEVASANVVQRFSSIIAGNSQYKTRYAAIAPAEKEKQYESLLISPMILGIFAKQLDKAGKAQDAVSIRASAGALFKQIIGMDPTQVQISADGLNIKLKPKAPAADAPAADAPPADAPPADAPAPDAPPAGPTQ